MKLMVLVCTIVICTILVGCSGGNNVVGVWHGNWNGYDAVLTFRDDGTGVMQRSSVLTGSLSLDFRWQIDGQTLRMNVTDQKGDFDLGGSFEFQEGSLIINHLNQGATVYTKNK